MVNQYNLYNLEASFREFLIAENITPITIKNYLSDFRHFLGWMIFKLKVEKESNTNLINEFINIELLQEYKSYLIENKLPVKTINRRLSTVRKFCSFCIAQGWMKENPAKKVANIGLISPISPISPILSSFQSYLEKQKLDVQTITSCLNDVEELLTLSFPNSRD